MSSVSSSNMRTVSRISWSVKGTRALGSWESDAVHETEHALVHHAHGVVVGAAHALQALLQGSEAGARIELHDQDQMEIAVDHALGDVLHADARGSERAGQFGEHARAVAADRGDHDARTLVALADRGL